MNNWISIVVKNMYLRCYFSYLRKDLIKIKWWWGNEKIIVLMLKNNKYFGFCKMWKKI